MCLFCCHSDDFALLLDLRSESSLSVYVDLLITELQVPEDNNPTCDSLKRACTTSFGSIAFGSLVVAVLHTLRAMIRMARDSARRYY